MSSIATGSGRRHSIRLIVAITAVLAAVSLPGRAVDLFTVKGTVRDAAGTPLANVRVSYTTRSTNTDALGKYTLGFSNAGTYAITAARSDLNPQTKNVNVATQIAPVDFALTYILSGAVSPAAFNTVPKTLTLTAASTAPSASCVTATIAPTNTVAPLSLSGTAGDGTSTWTGSHTVASGTADGSYQITYRAVKCGGSLLTNAPIQKYFLDRVVPSIDPSTLMPLDHGNTKYLSQPLLAKITDDRSGVDAGSIAFTFTDETVHTTSTYQGSSVAYDPATGWAKTGAITLQPLHVYRIAVAVSDYAGNGSSYAQTLAAQGGGFVAMTDPSIDEGIGTLYAEGVNTGQNGNTAGTKKWNFQPRMSIAGHTVHFPSGSKHAGWGTVAATLPVDGAKVRITIAGVTQDWTKKPYTAGTTKTAYQNVAYFSTNGSPADIHTEPASFTLPTVQMDLPLATQAAKLVLESAQPTAAFAGVCADPSTSSIACTPDPLRFFLPERFSDRLANFNAQAEMSTAGCVPGTNCLPAISMLKMVPDPTGPTTKGGIWKIIHPLVDFCSVNAPSPGTLCLINGVLYPTSTVLYPPEGFADLCSTTPYCTYESAAANDDRKYSCITAEGADRPYTYSGPDDGDWPDNPCHQTFTVFSWVNTKIGDSTKQRIHIFEGYWSSEWGVQDGDYDELGLHWATNDKHKEWSQAISPDVPEYGGEVVKAYHSGDSYPYGHTDEYYDCFYFANKHKIPSTYRVVSDNTGVAHGVGTGTYSGSIKGWPQWKLYQCSSGFVYVRTTSGMLRGVFKELRYPGDVPRNNGNVMTTWGHREGPKPDIWDFLDIACTLVTGGYGQAACNAYGVVMKLTEDDQTSNYEEKTRRDEDGPGPTPDWGFPYYERQ